MAFLAVLSLLMFQSRMCFKILLKFTKWSMVVVSGAYPLIEFAFVSFNRCFRFNPEMNEFYLSTM